MTFEKGVQVRRIDNPGKEGVVVGDPRNRENIRYFKISFNDGSVDYVAEDNLELLMNVDVRDPYAVLESGKFGRAENLRRSLTHVQLSGKLANLVYSMGITNTDFFAHQYKPLLTLLESPADGLLIADEVGLGKTIEAGIIWTELRAREDLRRLLIVCPAMLREKWRDELKNRFGIESQITDAKQLLDDLKNSSIYGPPKAWICSYQSLRPGKGWTPESKGVEKRKSIRHQLADLLDDFSSEDPLIDLVIFDEAHYMRNESSSANTLGHLLKEVSDYRVLLSATPINLASDDLFHLLKLYDPENFQYRSSFEEIIEANRPLIRAHDAALRPSSTANEIRELLDDATSYDVLAGSHQLASLRDFPPSDEQLADHKFRAELAASLDKINLLSHVVTRTRKRDVQIKRPRRDVKPERVEMSPVERQFYQFVTEVTRDYAYRREISDGFLLATPQRQVCSCPAAFAKAWLGNTQELVEDFTEIVLDDSEEDELEFDDISGSLKDFLFANRPRDIDVAELEKNDTKFTRFLTEISEYLGQNPEEKVVVFTAFRATARYLTERLRQEKIGTMLLWGGMTESKQDMINEFASQPEIRVLVSTEVASEGVDLQFCRLLVNYDLPWNPMRIEQRIGRIDRLGQAADVIHIWNIVYAETIDDRILSRLLERLRIFERALGEAEPIVGSEIQKLEARLLTANFTEEQEEAEVERVRQVLENVRVKQEQLEENSTQMIAHGSQIIERIEAARDVSKRVTEDDLVIYVRDFLSQHGSGHLFRQTENVHTYEIQLPGRVAIDLEQYCRDNSLTGQTMLVNGMVRECQFISSIVSGPNKVKERIHQFHPLIRFITYKLNALDETFYPIVAANIQQAMVPTVNVGQYMFLIRKSVFKGVKVEETLRFTACALDNKTILDETDAEKMVNCVRLHGTDWLESNSYVSSQDAGEILDFLEIDLEMKYKAEERKKKNENDDRVSFQLNSIEKQLSKKLASLENTRELHRHRERLSLVKATQGKIDKLKERMALKKEDVLAKSKITLDLEFVCAGFVNVQGGDL